MLLGALLASLFLTLLPQVARPARAADERCFPETGKCASGAFLQYWDEHGGLAQQGLPLTDVMSEVNPADGNTYQVQYFERARFEAHPENQAPYTILLGLLGREQYRAKYGVMSQGDGGSIAPEQGCRDFSQTGHMICGPFLAYWNNNGGLAQQGLQLTDVFGEKSLADGKWYQVQYFERARFEYHPENKAPNIVLLGLLGSEQFLSKYSTTLGPGSWAKVVDTAPTTGLRLRQGPNPWEALLAILPEGSLLQIVAGPQTGGNGDPWYNVIAAGQQGWVDGIYLEATAAPSVPPPAPAPDPPRSDLAVGSWGEVSGTAGTTGLRLRAAPSPAEKLLTVFPEGTKLKILEGPTQGANNDPWYRVAWNGSWGWVDGIYLVPTDAPPASNPAPPASTPTPPGTAGGDALVKVVMEQVGKPYVWGGNGPDAFDCSGLTVYAARKALGITLPRTADAQAFSGVHVDADKLIPGDLVFYENTYAPGITHVGVYIGGGRWVSAQDEKTGVVIISLDEPYWKSRYAGARRIT
jgi:cell wall-associated NlpC family hydrolase